MSEKDKIIYDYVYTSAFESADEQKEYPGSLASFSVMPYTDADFDIEYCSEQDIFGLDGKELTAIRGQTAAENADIRLSDAMPFTSAQDNMPHDEQNVSVPKLKSPFFKTPREKNRGVSGQHIEYPTVDLDAAENFTGADGCEKAPGTDSYAFFGDNTQLLAFIPEIEGIVSSETLFPQEADAVEMGSVSELVGVEFSGSDHSDEAPGIFSDEVPGSAAELPESFFTTERDISAAFDILPDRGIKAPVKRAAGKNVFAEYEQTPGNTDAPPSHNDFDAYAQDFVSELRAALSASASVVYR